jgi:hypothetical protein
MQGGLWRWSTLVAFGFVLLTAALAAVSWATSGPDKYTVRVPGGLAFSEFKGYEDWPVIAVSHNGGAIAAILGNPTIINAFKSGIPDNGKPFPDGSRMAKVHWKATKSEMEPGHPTVSGALDNVDFMVKDSKRFADSGGWGWAVFDYNAASDAFSPGTTADKPPQGNDAKCGFACHTDVKKKDFVFTNYGRR